MLIQCSHSARTFTNTILIKVPDDLAWLTKLECNDLSMDKANEDLQKWRLKGRGKKVEQARKRKRENVQALIEMGMVPASSSPKRVRFGGASVKTYEADGCLGKKRKKTWRKGV